MAIVANKAAPDISTDQKFCSYNRTSAGEPNGSLTPQFGGELVLDTTNNCLWKAIGTVNTSWVALTAPN